MNQLRSWVAAAFALAVVTSPGWGAEPAALLKLEKGDHVCIIGNALPERMQHDGWLETLIQARFPEHELVFRNLAFSGDEVGTWHRSMNFGSLDEWLSGVGKPIGGYEENRFAKTETRADVIFAFYGFNESFAGPEGLDAFKGKLDAWLKHTLAQKYNGKSAPRIVLFSPTAVEDLKNPDLPDGKARNENLRLYTAAMAEVAKANGVPLVDLFTPTLSLNLTRSNVKGIEPLTINGVHFNEIGNEQLAKIIMHALFPGEGKVKRDGAATQQLREAVKDKNWHWFHRYRTTDGYSTYGERAFLTFIASNPRQVNPASVKEPSEVLPTNYKVLQRELEVLDVKTSNRDKRIWAVAAGGDLKVDDSNAPPFITTPTNKPGEGPDGAHTFLGAEEAIAKMTPGTGLKVNLFASEEQFPELAKPVQMAWDTRGRLWVAAWPSYPHFSPDQPFHDKLLILEDTDNDGKADKCKTFADDLHNPTGFEFYNGGVIVAMAPNLIFLKDTDGDDKADVRQVLLSGFDTADTHHTINSFTFDPGGALYFQEGCFHRSQVETPHGPLRNIDIAVYRFEPRTWKLDVFAQPIFGVQFNLHGHVWDTWGQNILVDGTTAIPTQGGVISGRLIYPHKQPKAPQVYTQRTRPCSGIELLSSSHFPEEFQGNLLVNNVIGFLGILRYKLGDEGSAILGEELEPIVQSTDPNFRPADVEVGPDGAIYFTDWYNPIIGHMQHNLRDPSRDKTHGRVYRITHEGRELAKPAPIAGRPVEELLGLLKGPDDRVRYRAKIEMSSRSTPEVIAATQSWAASLDKSDPNYEHHMLEALWVHQWHNAFNEELLKRMLRSPEPKARAAATRVLCYWRDRVTSPLELLKVQVTDEHPLVRLEAVRACSFFDTPEAIEVALESVNYPQDKTLEYVLEQTMRTLEEATK